MFVEYTAGQCDIIPGFRLEFDSVCVFLWNSILSFTRMNCSHNSVIFLLLLLLFYWINKLV